MRAPLAVLAVLLLALPVMGAPNAREEPLAGGAPIVDTAIAHGAVADARGKFIVAMEDTASEMSARIDEAHLDTWRTWDADGDQLRAGDTDRTNCEQAVQDDCVGGTVGVDVSDDGRRMAAFGHIDPISISLAPSPHTAMAVFIDAQQGIIARHTLNDTAVDVAVSGNGARVAFLLDVEGATTTTSRLVVVEFPANSNVTVLHDIEVDAHLEGLAFDQNGGQVALWGDAYFQYAVGAPSAATTSIDTEDATDAAISAGADPLAVAGFAKGTVALFSRHVVGGEKVPVYSRQPATSDIASVAITRDGSLFAAGDASGKLHLFRTTGSATDPAAYLGAFTVGTGPVRDLAISDDARYIALRAGGQVQFLAWDGSAVQSVWKDTVSGTGLVMDGRGDTLAIAVGDDLRVYDALHLLTVTAQTARIAPGTSADVTLTIKNEGNRHETGTFSVKAPAGWAAALDVRTVDLAPPEAPTTLVLNVSVPDLTTPGQRTVAVNHTLDSGVLGGSDVRVDVPEVRRVVLEATGSRSIPIEPGAPGAFELEARNEGNVRFSGGFDITADDGWKAAITPGSVDLAPGASAAVELSVQAPDGIADGTAGMFTVAFEGDPSSAVELTATAGAYFEVAISLPRGFEAAVGNATPFSFTVENKGNAIDTVDIAAGPLPLGWTMALPSGLEEYAAPDLQPGEIREIDATLTISPDGVIGDRHRIDIGATSRANPAQQAEDSMLVTIGEAPEGPCPEGQELQDDGTCRKERSPSIALPLLLVAGLVLVLRRR